VRFVRLVSLVFFASISVLVSTASHAATAPASQKISVPLLFERNAGQFPTEAAFVSRGPGYALTIEGARATISVDVKGEARHVSMAVADRCPGSRPYGEDASSGRTHYLHGSDPKKWITNAQSFRKVRYDEIYDGIDLVFHGDSQQLEYDFEVAPHVSPDIIALDLAGMDDLRIDADGNLLLDLAGEELRQAKPVAYQVNADGSRAMVSAAFTLEDGGRVGFRLGEYDRSRQLIIDPILEFSTPVGPDHLAAVEVDGAGYIYIAGTTAEYTLPVAVIGSPILNRNRGSIDSNTRDVVIMKLTPNANDVVWATYVGGSSSDFARFMQLGASGEVFFAGRTESTDFPVTPGAFITTPSQAFITKLSANGTSLIYSTFIPGADSNFSGVRMGDFIVDHLGRAIIVGTTEFAGYIRTVERQPTPNYAFAPDAYVTRLSADGSTLDLSILFGSRGDDAAGGVVVDSQNNIYVAGTTAGRDFPTLNAAQPECSATGLQCSRDFFLTKFTNAGQMEFSTYWGGSGNEDVGDLALSPSGDVAIVGGSSLTDFPLVSALYSTGQDFANAVLAQFTPTGTVNRSTYLRQEFPYTARYNASGKLFLGSKGGVVLGATLSDVLWTHPFRISGAVDSAVDTQGNFYFVGSSDLLHTQPFPLIRTVSRDLNDHIFSKLGKVNVGAQGPDLLRISWMYPEGGRATGGRGFEIFGADRVDGQGIEGISVLFGGVLATGVYTGDSRISGTYPAHAPGSVNVEVITSTGNHMVLEHGFTYGSFPMSVTSMSPIKTTYPREVDITFTGSGFLPGARVTFYTAEHGPGDQSYPLSNVRVLNENTLVARTQPMALGVYGIRITNPHFYLFSPDAGMFFDLPNAFEFAGPTIISFNPSSIGVAGGNVEISGQGLSTGTVVSFGGVTASQVGFVTESGFDKLTVTAPPHAEGWVDVTIQHPGAPLITIPGSYLYYAASPAMTEFRPLSGPPSGGTSVTIVGTGFSPTDVIDFGGIEIKNKVFINATTWLVTTPPHHPGGASVNIYRQGGVSAGHSFNYVFTYTGPALSGIDTSAGSIAGGTVVKLLGSGFDNAATVTFGGVNAPRVIEQFSSDFKVTTGPHAIGWVDVVITNPDGTQGLLQKAFLYRGAGPTITSISPNFGTASTETFVTVVGSNFVTGPNGTVLEFNGSRARNINVLDSTTLTATVPAFTSGTFNVTVRNPDDQTATLVNGFTMKAAPQVSTVSPPAGPATGGTSIVISGSSFDPAIQVHFGTTPAASVTWQNAGQITVVSPAHAVGDVDLVLTNPENLIGTRTNGFRFLPPPPTIGSFTPNFAPPGSDVVITGTNFVFVTEVRFANVLTTFTVDSATQITAKVPGGSATGQITVTTQSGSATSVDTFTVDTAGPEVTSFTPNGGTGGTVVTITGTRFGLATSVTFGGVAATTFTIDNATQITATAPNAGNTGPICVNAPGPLSGCSLTDFFFPPRVTGFTPPQGLPGDNVTINGANFQGASAVSFNGAAASPFVVNPAGTTITTTVPANATTGPVTVTTPAGNGTSIALFGVVPEITSFNPVHAGPGTTVTIHGFRFTGATNVSFNGANATFSVVDASTINATVPVAATNGPISVTTPGGIATSIDAFEVAQTPVITSFTPIAGSPGTVVTITGTNFTGATSVKFAGAAAAFTIVNGTTITATVPSTASTGPISIANAEGVGTSAALFHLPPVLSSFAPSAGPSGASVTLNGNNFLGATEVKFNGVAASFVVNTNEKITVTVPVTSNGTITVFTPAGSASSAFPFTVLASGTPSVVATATSATTVALVWSGAPGHTYQVRRISTKNENFGTHAIASVTGNSFVDTTAVAGVTYLYNILDQTTNAIGNNDYATTIMFTDDPVVARGTNTKAVHVTQLRAAVNAMRVAAGLVPATWTDPAAAGLPMRASQIVELRTKLNDALLSLGRFASFTDSSLTAGMPVRAAHVRELREAVK
jgi:hypothetical protein